MRISGTEPSLVILSQTNEFKKLKKYPNCKVKPKRDGVINQQN